MTNSALAVRKYYYLCTTELFKGKLVDLNIWEITQNSFRFRRIGIIDYSYVRIRKNNG